MFPWVKIIKKTPPQSSATSASVSSASTSSLISPPLTTSLIPVPDEPIAEPNTSFDKPDAPTSTQPETISFESLTKRQRKNLRRRANRAKRQQLFTANGAVLYKSAKRLESQARCQQKRANRSMKHAMIHAKDAAEFSALTKEQFQPYFKDAESSMAYRDQNFTREKSREYLEIAKKETILSLRLKEAAKAARKGDLNPVEPEFAIKSVEKQLHKSYFK